MNTSSCKPIRYRTCSLNRRQSIESLFSINSILDFLFSMLMVHVINIIVVRITNYKKISSRTAADPPEQIRYKLKLYLERYSLVFNRRFAYGLAIWLCLQIRQIDLVSEQTTVPFFNAKMRGKFSGQTNDFQRQFLSKLPEHAGN